MEDYQEATVTKEKLLQLKDIPVRKIPAAHLDKIEGMRNIASRS